MRILWFTVFFYAAFVANAQRHPAYTLYRVGGKKVTFRKMVRKLRKADVVLFGEEHNNPIAHWLQFEVTKALLDKDTPLTIGAEMFERDNEPFLRQYLKGEIDHKGFDSLVRLWPNYNTDYKPLVDYAKTNNIDFVATNIPRRYASLVYRAGFEALESLPDNKKAWIAPLPIAFDPELPGYQQMLNMTNGHEGENFPKAQAIKDATMGHFILENYSTGRVFIHINGRYHSDNHGGVKGEGIVWYLKAKAPQLRCLTITTVSQKDIRRLDREHFQKADFIICVPENMTKTY